MGLRQAQGLPVRTTGMLYSLIGALLLTPDALILRWVAIDHSEVLLWRGVFFSLGFALIVLLRHRTKALRAIVSAGWPGLVSGFFFALRIIWNDCSDHKALAAKKSFLQRC